MQKPHERLAELFRQATSTLVFTGAGVSTGSGIPDFRGPDGLWKSWRPVYYDEFLASDEARKRHWDFKLQGWKQFRDAQPNAAHRALRELEQKGRLQTLVTQNIDGLHQLAGQSEERVIELHGTNRKIECVACGERQDPDPVFEEFSRTGEAPLCACGGFLKPATISFGQAMPVEQMQQALRAAGECDFCLSIGSTLEVEPAASVPFSAYTNGATYAILNQGPTAHDRIAHLRIEGDACQILPACLELL